MKKREEKKRIGKTAEVKTEMEDSRKVESKGRESTG
jgi:hypothetical protein